MAREFSGTGQYLTHETGLGLAATGESWWGILWVWLDNTSATRILFSIGFDGSSSSRKYVAWSTTNGIEVVTAGNSPQRASSAFSTTGAWTPVLFEFVSNTSRAVTVGGGSRVLESTTAILFTEAPNQVRVAASHTASALHDGRLAYIGLFSGTPHANDFTDLLAGGVIANAKHPTLTHSAANLIAYWDLDGVDSPEPDGVGSNDLTLTGSPTQIASPGIILSEGPIQRPPAPMWFVR